MTFDGEIEKYYIHVQYLADDPDYDFDYTIYDSSAHDIDGGVIGSFSGWDLRYAVINIIEEEKEYGFLKGRNLITCTIEEETSENVLTIFEE